MRALFREIARDIIGRDRDARKAARTQNTIGEVERALAKAFVWGQEALLDKAKVLERGPGDAIDWMEIPPRARSTLSMMTLAFSEHWLGSHRESARADPDEIEMFVEDGRKRWAIVRGDQRHNRSVGDGSVAPLIRLGLLCPDPDNPERWRVTESGVAAARDYWRRSDADDPTLPRESLR
jgi:hypothetical protein